MFSRVGGGWGVLRYVASSACDIKQTNCKTVRVFMRAACADSHQLISRCDVFIVILSVINNFFFHITLRPEGADVLLGRGGAEP